LNITKQKLMDKMKILIACEFSGIVRDAFAAKGYDVISCDLLPTERPGKHYQGDVMDIINNNFNLGLFFTPCTYSCNSGIRWMYNADGSINKERFKNMQYYAGMIRIALNSNIPLVGCENPIPHHFAIKEIGRKYDQIIQPWQFGHGEQKATCLWLKGLPRLQPTNIVEGREQRIWKMPPSKDRAKERSRTLAGIANAMADQWG